MFKNEVFHFGTGVVLTAAAGKMVVTLLLADVWVVNRRISNVVLNGAIAFLFPGPPGMVIVGVVIGGLIPAFLPFLALFFRSSFSFSN